MSYTTTTHETVSTDVPASRPHTTLTSIVSQSILDSDDLPDWEAFRAVCETTQRTIELTMPEAI